MKHHLLTELTNSLAKYQHIFGEATHGKDLTPQAIIEQIASYYEAIINCMPGNVYWIDKHCIMIGCNKNVLDMLGFKNISEFKGLDFERMGKIGKWTKKATAAFKRDTMSVLKTGKPRLNIEEPPIPHSDGRTIYFLTSRVPLFDQSNQVIGIVGISIDITELRNAQIELKNAKKAAEIASSNKSEFIANMSHDIKTPLTGIIGLSELLLHRLKLNNEHHDLAETLLTSSRELLNFFEHCLDLFRLEKNDLSIENEIFDLKKLLDDISRLFKPAIQSKGLVFNLEYHNYLSDYFIGSPTSIYRILLNLVGNAVKFTHQGSITISTDVSNKLLGNNSIIKFTVSDTGIGIPPDKQHIIFDRFTRLTPSYKGTYDGSGMGLYIVKKYITSLGGEIYFRSELGKGSEFTVIIPVKAAANDMTKTISTTAGKYKQRPLKSDATPQNKSQLPSARILLVEDNSIVQRIQRELITSLGHSCDIAESGEQALELFEPGKYDIIFMDIGLPGIQGDTTAKLIRKMEAGNEKHVCIVALTAHTTENSKRYCHSNGIEAVYSKPLSLEETQQIIETYLGSKSCHPAA